MEEPAALGPPPHMATICCGRWRLSPFPGHVLASLPQLLPLCRRVPVCTYTCPPPLCICRTLYPFGLETVYIPQHSVVFNSSLRLRYCTPHSVAVSRSNIEWGWKSWYQTHEFHPGCTTLSAVTLASYCSSPPVFSSVKWGSIVGPMGRKWVHTCRYFYLDSWLAHSICTINASYIDT